MLPCSSCLALTSDRSRNISRKVFCCDRAANPDQLSTASSLGSQLLDGMRNVPLSGGGPPVLLCTHFSHRLLYWFSDAQPPGTGRWRRARQAAMFCGPGGSKRMLLGHRSPLPPLTLSAVVPISRDLVRAHAVLMVGGHRLSGGHSGASLPCCCRQKGCCLGGRAEEA